MARTFGAATSDKVQAVTSASLDSSDPIGTVLIELFPTTLTSNRVLCSHLTAGGEGWNLRLSGTAGDIEFRQNRVTATMSYITNDTPLSALNAWRRVALTFDLTSPSAPHVYHDKATPGTLVESTYGTTTLGTGTVQSAAGEPFVMGNSTANNVAFQGRIGRVAIFKRNLSTSEMAAWFANPRGDDADCVAFYCLGTASPEPDFSGTTTLDRNPGTVTGTSVSDGSALAAGIVTRTVGSNSRQVAHVTDVVTFLNGKSISATTGNVRIEYTMYDDSVFTFTADQVFTGFTADPYVSATDASTKCCVLLKVPINQRHFLRKGVGVRWRRTNAPAASTYLFDNNVPGLCVQDVMFEYTGGTVSSDATQIRMFRIDHGALGQSELHRCALFDFNSVRPLASIVGFSLPGGAGYSCVVVNTGIGQDPTSTRNYSCAPDSTAVGQVGFWGCSSYGAGGDGFRYTANGLTVTVYVHNCIAVGSARDFWNETVGGNEGAHDLKNLISGDATATGTGAIINVTVGAQFVDGANGAVQPVARSSVRGAGLDEGSTNTSKVDIMGFDRDATGVVWDVGAVQYQEQAGRKRSNSRRHELAIMGG